MLLVAVATENEIRPLKQFFSSAESVKVLVTGLGPVATAATLSNYLSLHGKSIRGVINIGVGGAYFDSGLTLLDICLAQQEVFGDFGVCMQDEILDFDPGHSSLSTSLLLNNELFSGCRNILNANDVNFKVANFVTVNCCSGTRKRGDYLQKKFAAGCENMEGAAVAMVCNTFSVPCVEMRCISNMVVDRAEQIWDVDGALSRCSEVIAILVEKLGCVS